MPRKSQLLLIICGLFMVTIQASAGMYRWTDDEGNVVYSQTPPADARPVKPIAPPPPPAENPGEIQKETRKLQEQLDNIAKERDEKKKKQLEAELEQKKKEENCQTAKGNLKSIQEKPPNTLFALPDGSYKRFTMEERQKKIDAMNKIIKENCE
ncbi:MAG TPA: DUF4124 domain-containing protein [Chromatiaceae bacterium]|nr:DUF4124 domain-containing protein [Chromatiaceae bacterium]